MPGSPIAEAGADASPRVLFLTENYPPGWGGMSESCDRIVHGLREAGAIIDLCHLSRSASKQTPGYQPGYKIEEKHRGRHILWPVPSDGDPVHALNCLWDLLTRPGSPVPTHVVAFGGTLPILCGPVYAAWLGVPLITLLRGNDLDAGVFTERRREVLREALIGAARVCVVSRDHARKVAALYPGARTACIPNGIDLSRWALLPSDRERAAAYRRSLSGAEPRRVLGIFGHIKRKKGGLFFLTALLASGLAGRFHLLLVGELEPAVIAFLDAHAAELSHTRHPFTDRYELLGHYAACDLQVIPSYYDGMPNVLLEAAGLGVPLLCSTAGGMADVLTSEHAFLFHPGDEEGCREALERAAAATDEDLALRGAACRTLCQTCLTPGAETQGYLSVLRETAGLS